MDQDQLPGQMTIFDFLRPPERPLEDLPENEMVKMITDTTGLKFSFIDSFWGWQVKEHGVLFSVQYDNYLVDDKRRFIGADWQTNHQGQSSPCDSVQEAIDFFLKAIASIRSKRRTMKIPDKCKDCEHAIVQLENVHDGWGKYHLDSVVRCDCFPVRYKVGCVCAEVYCKKRILSESDDK